jgi:hypothetical protein
LRRFSNENTAHSQSRELWGDGDTISIAVAIMQMEQFVITLKSPLSTSHHKSLYLIFKRLSRRAQETS